MGWAFTNGLGYQGSMPSQAISKTQKMVLDASLLNTQHYKVLIKGQWSNPGKEVEPSHTPRCSSYWKGSLKVCPWLWLANLLYLYIYPASQCEKDVTQSQFLKLSLTSFEFRVFLLLNWLPYQGQRAQFALLSTHSWRKNNDVKG